MKRPLAISTGDPGGVGPEVAARSLSKLDPEDSAWVFGDAAWLRARLTALGAGDRCVDGTPDKPLPPGALGLVQAASWEGDATRHTPTAAGGAAQLAVLAQATRAALSGQARALVTAPMSKAAVNLAGHRFRGHTEYLAEAAGMADDGVTMMFLGPRLRVALATTHIAIADAPREVTRARVLRAIGHMGAALLRLAGHDAPTAPRLWVAGLNPHAGEGGLFGREEQTALEPAVADASQAPPFADGRVRLTGPVGAETAFRMAADSALDGVVAMLHDQATIASKLLDWGEAVNVTWGLPFVRTSVDHGVAYDAAAAGTADPAGMIAAVALAQQLAP